MVLYSWKFWAIFLLLVFLILTLGYPIVSILSLSFRNGFDIFWNTVLTDSYYLDVLMFTTWQATASTLLTLLIGLPSAYVFAHYSFPGKRTLRGLTTVPFVMPPLVIALGFVALLGDKGLINSLLQTTFRLNTPPLMLINTIYAILIAHVMYEFTIVVRIVSTAWANLDPDIENAARILGANRWNAFRKITLPLLLPSIIAASSLIFAFTFTSFGVVLILGGAQYATLEVSIYTLAAHLFQLPAAGVLALIQMAITIVFMTVYARYQQRTSTSFNLVPNQAVTMTPQGKIDKLLCLANYLIVLIVLSPLIALIVRALLSNGDITVSGFTHIFSNQGDSFFFVSPLQAITNSLLFGACTVILAVPMGIISGFLLGNSTHWGKAFLDSALMLPLGISAVTMGFGFLIAFNNGIWNLSGSWTIIVMAHAVIAYPFVLRSILPVLRSMPPSLREAAQVLGASKRRIFIRIDLPILWRSIVVGLVFAFAVSLGEFGATLLLHRPEHTTMPVAIFRYLSQPGESNLLQALSMSCVLMFVSAAGFITIERLRFRNLGGF
jgi:thiamine transport system permease protein